MADVLDKTKVNINNDVERISTGIEGAEKQDDFIVTRNALNVIGQVREQNEIPEDYKLRIGTQSGCCSGVNFSLGFDSEVHDSDVVLNSGEVDVVIDDRSLFMIQGVTLDYIEGPSGTGFVFNNPNASAHSCGCGGH